MHRHLFSLLLISHDYAKNSRSGKLVPLPWMYRELIEIEKNANALGKGYR